MAIASDGERSEISFGEVADRSARLAGALAASGVGRGDVVTTVVGNRPEWAYAMLACWRIGAVAQPCTEQLRLGDLAARMEAVEPRAVFADARNLELVTAAGFDGPLLTVPDAALYEHDPAPVADVAPGDPALIVFTSGTAGDPSRCATVTAISPASSVQAEHWYDARGPGSCAGARRRADGRCRHATRSSRRGCAARLRCCTTRASTPTSGSSCRARGRERALHVPHRVPRDREARDPAGRFPGLRHACAAGEPLNPEVVHTWQERVGVAIHDGYGQTETGHLTGMPLGEPVRPGSMGRPLPGFRAWIEDGELVVDPATVPTFFLDGPRDEPWRTGDRVREDEDGYLWFEGRTDDVIISAGYRIGPFEVESALVSHPAVAEAAAVAAPDEIRGHVVRAVVVLRDGYSPARPGRPSSRST